LAAAAVVLGSQCADPFSRRVLRVSMGAALHLPIVESRDLAADLAELAAANSHIAAAMLDPAAESLKTARRGERLALMLGNEAHGVADQWLNYASRRVTIPMQLGVDSLNVAVAAAVMLFHFTTEQGVWSAAQHT
jgi:tRNA G18 (ribose-2'-O)-methylase SpoU